MLLNLSIFSILQLHSYIFVRVCASHCHARIEEIKEMLVQSTVRKKDGVFTLCFEAYFSSTLQQQIIELFP